MAENSDPGKRDSLKDLTGTLPTEALDLCSRIGRLPSESEQSHDFQISKGDFSSGK